MKKIDRAILIFIGLGIWALAMTQVFSPSNVVALGGDDCGGLKNPCYISVKGIVQVTELPRLDL